MPTELHDTTDIYSSHAFVIGQEKPFVTMLERLGISRLEYRGDQIVVFGGASLVEMGSGPTVRRAYQAALEFWNREVAHA